MSISSRTTALALAALTVLGTASLSARADVLYSQDFETGSTGLTGGYVTGSQDFSSVGFGQQIYRTDGYGSSTSADLTVNLAQAVTGVSLQASLAIIDSWDNGNLCCGPDSLTVKVDGQSVFTAVFDNYQNQGATQAAGLTSLSYGSNLGFSGFNDAAYRLNLNLGNLSAGTHTVSFVAGGPGWQGGSDESLGVDNLQLNGVAAVPEPASVLLMVAGLGGLGLRARRQRQG